MVQFLATDGQRGRKGRVVNSLGTGVEASLTLLNSDGSPRPVIALRCDNRRFPTP